MKCNVCKSKIQETFLKKILGGYVKDSKGKKHLVCPACQRKFRSKQELLENL